MDIPQCLEATAVVTVGKDMTFRDYAQGAFRMRGIGAGQTIKLYLIPEVTRLVREHAAIAQSGGNPGFFICSYYPKLTVVSHNSFSAGTLEDDNDPYIGECNEEPRKVLVDVSAFLVVCISFNAITVNSHSLFFQINSMRMEKMQYNVLLEQNVSNVCVSPCHFIISLR